MDEPTKRPWHRVLISDVLNMIPFFAIVLLLPMARLVGAVFGANDFTLDRIGAETHFVLLFTATICGLVYSAVLVLRIKDCWIRSASRRRNECRPN